jgi:hypothetical protein
MTSRLLPALAVLWALGCQGPASGPKPPQAGASLAAHATSPAAQRAYAWLRGRIGPLGLASSFEASGVEGDLAVTYDQAVAIDALLVMGDVAAARKILDAMKGLQAPDGGWWTMYSCTRGTVVEQNQTVGQVVWMALAVAKYEQRTGDTVTYHAMGRAALDWAFRFQAPDGAVNGGIVSGAPASWAGTEFNEDVFAASLYFGGHDEQAARVRHFIDTAVWAGDHFMAGRGDPRDPLDVNAWSVPSLGRSGPHPYEKTLDYNLTHHRVTLDSFDAFDFNSDKDDIWFEGTGEMILSLKETGRRAEADHFMSELVKAQRPNGGIPYSLRGTFNDYWKMTAAPCISSTGWLLLAEAEDNPFRFGKAQDE